MPICRNPARFDCNFNHTPVFSLPVCYDNYKEPFFKEVECVGTEKERRDTQKALLYDERRLLKNSGKETYATEGLRNLLGTIAGAKDQE